MYLHYQQLKHLEIPYKVSGCALFKIPLDKLKIIEKSEVGIYFDTLLDYEVQL